MNLTDKGAHPPAATLLSYFHVDLGREYHKGDIIARGYIDTGDHVFVDKVSYNFRPPRHGEVFVFNTKGIPTNENNPHPDEKNHRRAVGRKYFLKMAGC